MSHTFTANGTTHILSRYSGRVAGGFSAPVAECGAYGRQGQNVSTYAADCERCISAVKLTCLDSDEECAGNVEYRSALSGTGIPYPRCDFHWTARLKVQEGINRRYPTMAPADFDPSYAGESWDDEY